MLSTHQLEEIITHCRKLLDKGSKRITQKQLDNYIKILKKQCPESPILKGLNVYVSTRKQKITRKYE